MIKGAIPRGFTISFRRGKRWTWKQAVPMESADHVVEQGGFSSWRDARAGIDFELARRKDAQSKKAEAAV